MYNLIILIFINISILSIQHKNTNKQKIIYLIRHGTTSYNKKENLRVRGRSNISLSNEGIEEIQNLKQFLKDINLGQIISSPLERAKQSAKIIGENKTIIEEELINEMYFGDWENEYYKNLYKNSTDDEWYLKPNNVVIPNGETFYAVLDRINKFLIKFWESNENIITVVTHGDLTSLFALIFMNFSLDKFWTMYMQNGRISKIIMNNIGDYRIDYWNLKPNKIGGD